MSYDYYYSADAAALAGILGVYYVFAIAIGVIGIIAMWKLYVKAGEEGWAAIVPFYSQYIMFKITWGNGLMFLTMLIPFANVVIYIMTLVKLAKVFGKGGGWACGLIFLYPIFILIMAFSNDIRYVGIDGQGGNMPPPPGGYGGYQNPYQQPYQQNPYQQPNQNPNQNPYQPPYQQPYTQPSAQNPDYHYQRNEPQAPAGNFCPGCGAKVDAGTKFCPGCGKPL